MKKYIVLSTNNNPDYFFYLPYQEKAWNRYGWNVIVMVTPDFNPIEIETTNPETLIFQLPQVPEIRPQTLAQMGRLYAAHYVAGMDQNKVLLMTCDMDLIPLSDYWHPDPNKITVFGHDLTWRSYYPMGYVAMTADKWIEKMQITQDTRADILRDCDRTYVKDSKKQLVKAAYSDDWEAWWNVDWRLLTDRLEPFKNEIDFVDRGQVKIAGATLARGRVDRYNWKETQNQPDWIDAHCHNNNVTDSGKVNDFLSVFEKVHGKL